MRITYEWTEREWDQAVRVATRKSTPGAPLPGLIYALIGIPLLGAVGDLVSLVRSSARITLAGSIVPMLLLLFAVTAAALIGVSGRRRRRQREGVTPMPAGTREMVLQESGWRFDPLLAFHHGTSNALANTASSPLDPEPIKTPTLDTLTGKGSSAGTVPRPLRLWSEVLEARQGRGVIVLVHRGGFEAVPTKALTPEQAGHLHRLVTRKMRPPV